MRWILRNPRFLAVSVSAVVLMSGASALLSVCGPFTDVAADAFCPFVLEIFTLGITTGVTPTTYDPSGNVTRLQMAAFLSRTVDRTIQRSSRRAAVVKYWRPQNSLVMGLTTVGTFPVFAHFDGADIWVTNRSESTVSRVRASDGKLLETWTGSTDPWGVESAMGRIVVTGELPVGRMYSIDPTKAAGVVTTVVSTLPTFPGGVAFDGGRFWTTSPDGWVVMVTPGAIPWTFSTVTAGFTHPTAPVFDGTNMWVTDTGPATLLKLGPFGAVIQTVTVGLDPRSTTFDGSNIWVTNEGSGTVSVVRASTGAILATLTGPPSPRASAFDGERVLVTDYVNDLLSLWKAADLTSLGVISAGGGNGPWGVCSDGANFWIVLRDASKLARF